MPEASTELLVGVAAEARSAWPEVALDDDVFVDAARERLRGAEDPTELRLRELWLAIACTRDAPGAVSTLHTAYAEVWKACFAGAPDADELEQRFLSRLLVATPDRPAALAGYGGRGTLRSWLRVAATRLRVDAHRRDEAAERAERGAAAVPIPRAGLEPELDYLKLHYRAEFEAALSEAWRELEPRERNLLRHLLLDGLSATHVAEVYGVHRSTAKRWLADARARLLDTTRAALRGRLRVDDRELDSVLRLVESRLEVTARVFLQTRDSSSSG